MDDGHTRRDTVKACLFLAPPYSRGNGAPDGLTQQAEAEVTVTCSVDVPPAWSIRSAVARPPIISWKEYWTRSAVSPEYSPLHRRSSIIDSAPLPSCRNFVRSEAWLVNSCLQNSNTVRKRAFRYVFSAGIAQTLHGTEQRASRFE